MMLYSFFVEFVLGSIFGSFLGALIYRFPRSISIAEGRSFCDKCKKQISWYDNIPILSFLILGGKCRNCKSKIPGINFIIELTTGIGFVVIGFQPVPLILFCLLEVIFTIDLEHQIIPDIFIFIGLAVLFLNQTYSSLLAGFLAASFLLLIHLFTKGRGMGLGDVKFAVLGGAVVGLQLTFVWLFLAFLTGATVGIILILAEKAKIKDKIAFGPFLVIAIPLTIVYGQRLIDLIGVSIH